MQLSASSKELTPRTARDESGVICFFHSPALSAPHLDLPVTAAFFRAPSGARPGELNGHRDIRGGFLSMFFFFFLCEGFFFLCGGGTFFFSTS